jgi:hypothetical protein
VLKKGNGGRGEAGAAEMEAEAPARVGRPPHEPTDRQREQVQGLAALWVPQRAIASFLGISENTLRRHYPDELEHGAALGDIALGTCFRAKLEAGDTAAVIYATKIRFGWSERMKLEHSGPNGGPLQAEHYLAIPPDQRRQTLQALADRVLGPAAVDAPADGFAPDTGAAA